MIEYLSALFGLVLVLCLAALVCEVAYYFWSQL